MVPGDVVTDRFEILRGAGSGGMGVVYQARDRSTGGEVALKLLLGGEERLAARFAQEVEMLSSLEHPHIIGYVSHGATVDGAPYLVMPWLDGQDLQERIRAKPLSVEETITVAGRVADALAYLHRRGLVHRDLKPTNIFLPQGRLENLQVIDLGIARGTVLSRSLTLSGVLLGTPGFIAPEQAYGAGGIAPTVDIFALGCVLFECLTGKRLFSGPHVMAVLAKVLLEEAPHVRELRPDVPEALERLIERMVAKEPELRPQDGAELQKLVTELEGGASSENARIARPVSLTASEQRVISVLMAVVSPAHPSPTPMLEVTRAEVTPLQSRALSFGVEIHALAEGVAIALAPQGLTAADGAAMLARFGAFVARTYEQAHIALSTGSAVTAARSRLPVGEAIDRGVTMVRDVVTHTAEHGVQLDEVSAALLTSRFDVHRKDGRLYLASERLLLDPTRPLLGRPTSCVGRDQELTILDAAYADCVEGMGPKIVLMTAPSGAGKSRLRHELVRRLGVSQKAKPRVLLCQGNPLYLATPYAQIAQAVRQMVRVDDGAASGELRTRIRDHVASLFPENDVVRITDFLGELVGANFDDDEHVALRAARHNETAMADQIRLALEQVLRAWTAVHPVVLVMEDLHWADAMSVKVLDGVLRKLAGDRLLVLALARPEVTERFPRLWSNRNVTEIRLPPLSRHASSRLVREVMGDECSDEEMIRIVDRAEGNAFYLEELLRAAVDRSQRRSSLPSPLPEVGFPETIIAVAQARLERMEPQVRKVLRAASVFGERFWEEGVRALVRDTAAALPGVFEVLVAQETVFPSQQSRLSGAREMTFRHALLREAAYASLTDGDRTLGHRLAAAWLESADEDREVVAIHWLAAGDRARAAIAFAHAADTRLGRAQTDAAARCALRSLLVSEVGAKDDAKALLESLRVLAEALETARTVDPREVMAGLEAHVLLPENARGPKPTRSLVYVAVQRSLSTLRSADASTVATASARGASCLGAVSEFAAAKRLLADASAIVDEHEASSRALRYVAAKVAFWEGRWFAVVDNLSTTVLPADARERVAMLILLAMAVVSTDGREALARGLEYAMRAQALADALPDDPVLQVSCRKAKALCFFFVGEHQRSAEVSAEAVALSRAVGLRYEEAFHLHNQGESLLRIGKVERGRIALVAAGAIAEDLGAEPLGFHNDILLAYIDGDVERLQGLADLATGKVNQWLELHARYWLARLLADNVHPHARREFERTLALARELKVRLLVDECALAIAGLPPERPSQLPPPS